jgi:hypothetical protein
MSRRGPRLPGKKKGAGRGRQTDPRDDPVLLAVACLMVWERWPEKDVLGALYRVIGPPDDDPPDDDRPKRPNAEKVPFQRLRDRFIREKPAWLKRARETGQPAAVLDPSFSDDRSHAKQYRVELARLLAGKW